MYDNIGKNIKELARVLCWVGVIVNIILGLVMFARAGDSYYAEGLFMSLGFVFLIVGPIISIINGMLIYGFGELIDNNVEIKKRGMAFDDGSRWTGKEHINVDDTMKFGNYHGAVEWLVLDKKDGKELLISKYCLDAKEYDKNENNESVTWETCTLRQWLNDEFFNEAFSEKEKELICDTHLQNPDNPEYGTDGGNDTTDKVFLLSIDEASRYFADNEARLTYATAYAKENGAGDKNAWWGLRSPGEDENNVAMVGDVGSISIYSDGKSVYVNKDGAVNCNGQNVGSNFGIRPAIWANIE